MKRWLLIGALLIAAPIVASLPMLSVVPSRDTSQEILVRIQRGGVVEVSRGPRTGAQEPVLLDAPAFDPDNEPQNAQTLEALRGMFADFVAAGERTPPGVSRLLMRIEATPGAPVVQLLWLLMLGAEPEIQIVSFALSTRGREESVPIELPADGRLAFGSGTPRIGIAMHVRASEDARQLFVALDAPEDGPIGEAQQRPWPGFEGRRTWTLELDRTGAPRDLSGLRQRLAKLRADTAQYTEITMQMRWPPPRDAQPLRARSIVDLIALIQEFEDLDVALWGVRMPRAAPLPR